ncbi:MULTISPECIES: nitrate regulatory protein [Variovorax]|uniref:nitrate regulatory protein n=1 Tax=Variovorax TaxID=34072 RepID=UPI00086EFA80|nr:MULTISPECIES: nitrate regulatory protein [Variovorax]MBN8753722.1 nitrate- and nitrite sensing domain-containing protein [Variovorax sp.]ODU17356.1 MAG: antitermination regulator [Variovorax sp. SCN 67-85]ODV24381.1 MAG: antitermination regulator [Variovorax sp. SCN 67-20]OJZ02642.1 MAG: antitermination regulator [Variovorax sp. 67-131]UKI10888.1 nitrate- and nitrite sensing domain-containing protein [Variovorax paradoxus]
MKSGLSFLIAARRCEIDELDQLARTSELVGLIGRLVHALQRERGMSNVFLASHGVRLAEQRAPQIAECLALEQEVRAGFDQLEAEHHRGLGSGNGARLFSRIAWVLPGLDALPALRRRIDALELRPSQSTAAFVKLIAGLLSVVFEAADGATDPEISRLLVAMFNFMQGKEFAGQERAFGAAALAMGRSDETRRLQWQHLIESQERCFQVFIDFSGDAVLALWRESQSDATMAELERMRRRGATSAPADAALGQAWFDCCTRRIDAMRTVEDRLAADLRALCSHKTARARSELLTYRQVLDTLAPQTGAALFFDDADADAQAATPAQLGRHLERSVLDMVQEQSHRLQAMSDELQTVRASLNERKLVERAKGLLMAHRRMSEQEAHKMLRETAMNQGRRLVEVAESVLAMADYLSMPERTPPR